MNNNFIDSNIWLYAFMESKLSKHDIANKILNKEKIFLSIQVINEVCFNLKRKAGYNEKEIYIFTQNIAERYFVANLDIKTVLKSIKIREKYAISFWDSHIIASALLNNCSILYTEDMQHNQIIENTLKIINPFK